MKWLFAGYFMYDYINVNFNGKLNPSGKIFLRKKMRDFFRVDKFKFNRK